MAFQPLEKLLPQANFQMYKLVLMAARRATELADGQPALIESPSLPKATTIALDEIVAGKVMLGEVAAQQDGTDKKAKKASPKE